MNVKTSLEMSKDINKPEQLITEHIDIWTRAILAKSTSGRGSSKKYELYGISKLRELILELAVRGKLVPQDANDEPASVLLEKIAAEKAQLIKEKKIKKTKADSGVNEDEKLFELPSKWQWTRLNLITEINPRNTDVDDKTKVSFVPMTLITTSYDGVHDSESRLWSEIKKGYTHFANGDIAIAKITPCFENSKAAIFRNLENGIGAGTTELHVARPFGEQIERNFLLLYFKSPNFLTMGQKLMTGSAGHKRVPRSFFESNPIPLAEQKRIVDKVDELMLLCDQLEQQTEASIDAHATLVEVLLATLADSADADELAQNWARITEHFDSLFTTIKSIDLLKTTVIRLAVQGKLVSQDPNDESVSVQLEKINNRKSELVKNGEVKVRSLPKITDEEVSSDLPVGWEVIRLGNAMNVLNGRAYKKHEMLQEGTPLLRVGNLFTSKEWYYSDLELEPDKYINNGDLIYAWSASFGPFIWKGDKVIYHYHIWKLDLYDNTALSKAYLYNYLLSITEEIKASGNGIAMIHMTKGRMEELILPIPPLAEQHRIVAKVDEIMAICDQLKERLKQSQETQVQLTDALVDQALG
jgi:type I restriction enzyme S subunit